MVEWMRGIQEQPLDLSLFDPSAFDLEAADTAAQTLLDPPRPSSWPA